MQGVKVEDSSTFYKRIIQETAGVQTTCSPKTTCPSNNSGIWQLQFLTNKVFNKHVISYIKQSLMSPEAKRVMGFPQGCANCHFWAPVSQSCIMTDPVSWHPDPNFLTSWDMWRKAFHCAVIYMRQMNKGFFFSHRKSHIINVPVDDVNQET